MTQHPGDFNDLADINERLRLNNFLRAFVEHGVAFDSSIVNNQRLENLDALWLTFTSSTTLAAEIELSHELARVPIGWLVVYRDTSGELHDSGTTWTKNRMYLISDTVSTTYRILIF